MEGYQRRYVNIGSLKMLPQNNIKNFPIANNLFHGIFYGKPMTQ